MGADKSAQNTPNAPKFICPRPKVWYFKEKMLHWASVVRAKKLTARGLGTKSDIFGVPDCILRYAYIIWSFLWALLTAKAKIIEHTLLVRECVNICIAPKQTRKKRNSVHTS